MSFDKYMGKEHRKQFTGAKLVDGTCRNHGSCPYCKANRLYKTTKQQQIAEEKLHEWSAEKCSMNM